MAGQAAFCNKCGAPLVEAARFCMKCGAPRPVLASGPAATGQPAVAATPSQAPNPVAPTFSAAAVGGLGGAGTIAAALPWQTIVAGETPDLRSMLASVAAPTARRVAQASLRKPGVSLAATTVLDLLVAGLSGGTSAVATALPRAIMGGISALLAMVTGRKGGALRTVTGIVSLVTALVQAGSLLTGFVGGLTAGSSVLTLVPMAIATGSALTMAFKTASMALRRRS